MTKLSLANPDPRRQIRSNMNIPRFPLLLAAVAAALGVLPVVAKEKPVDPKLAARAKLTRAQAEAIALKAVPNATVKEAELEDEDGRLRWSFDLKTPGSRNITEVGVDAVSGKVVENKVESDEDEAREKNDDEKSKPAAKP